MSTEPAAVSPPSVLVFEQIDPTDQSLAWLESRGVSVTRGRAMWREGFQRYTEPDIIEAARGFTGAMGASGAHFTRRVIEALPDLRYISKYGIGVDSIDLAAASQHGIRVTNTPVDTQVVPVCEHAIAMILALRKRLTSWTPLFMANGGWRGDIFASSIAGTTVGIVGFGRIGRGVAQRLAGWDVELLSYDPMPGPDVPGVTRCGFEDLLKRSDVVTLHAAPSPENKGMMNRETLALMKPDALLINTGRAWLVDYPALREALLDKRLGGAGLDVFETEPPDPKDPLFTMPNVVVTPHSATWTLESMKNMGWRGARNMWAMLSGEGEADFVNP